MAPAGDLHVHVVIDQLIAGGAEFLLADLAAGAPAAGLRLTVGALRRTDPAPAADRLRDAGVEPDWIGSGKLLDPRSLLTVRRHLSAVAPDVVHTHLLYSDILGALAARSLGLPCVSTIHVSSWHDDVRERVRLSLAARARRIGAHRVLAVSDAARAAFLARGWDSPRRVLACPSGVASRAEPGAGAGVRAELGLRTGDLVVTMLAGLREVKGHDVAIAAVRAVRERLPSVRLVIAGEGPLRAAIEAQAAPLGDTVVMAGLRTDAMALLDASDVLLHPSRVESLPTAIIEALAAGVPVVASTAGGIPEIVEDGVSGVLVPAPAQTGPLAAALTGLLGDPARRRDMAAAGRARFHERFSADVWALRLREVYADAVRTRRP